MLDNADYTIEANRYQGNGHTGNGYHKLQGDYALFYKVAKGFTHRVKPEDRADFLHDLLLAMAKVKGKYTVIGKPLTEAGLIRIACYEKAQYWRDRFRRTNGTDCSRCSKTQREQCKQQDLYRDCPKAIRLENLDKPIVDSEGNLTDIGELIADDKAIDLDAWVDARTFLLNFPDRLIDVAGKVQSGDTLSNTDKCYLKRFRQKEQKVLI